MRTLSLTDRALQQFDVALRTVFGKPPRLGSYPAKEIADKQQWSEEDRRHAAGLMRINHTGEVCAQALYYGQAMLARSTAIRDHLLEAAEEEGHHLAWCAQRLDELSDRPSLLNGLWYTGAFTIGAGAALVSDAVSLGFVHETERQVEAHLHDHMERLPEGDDRSRAIVRQMAEDEARHGQEAMEAGGSELPEGLRTAMTAAADVMKLIVYRL